MRESSVQGGRPATETVQLQMDTAIGVEIATPDLPEATLIVHSPEAGTAERTEPYQEDAQREIVVAQHRCGPDRHGTENQEPGHARA
ncbi:MAG: hypothetical protein ACLFSI_08835, partial [Halorhodospira sp.]